MENNKASMKRFWLLLSNSAMMVGWARVLWIFVQHHQLLWTAATTEAMDDAVDDIELIPTVRLALTLSFLELLNACVGATRSKPLPVLLFSVVRFGTEVIVGPMLIPHGWQHLLTVFCWSLGDTVRFACFVGDNLFPGQRVAKMVRYTVGPLVFPFGASGEMLMVIAAARRGRPGMYIAAALWPVGFYPLFTQLLRQRRKFLRENFGKTEKKVKVV